MIKAHYLSAALCLLFTFSLSTAQAQEDKSKRKSQPAITSQQIDDLIITIDYSQPSANGRQIWGNVVKYNEVWRTGANEATTIAFNKDVVIDGRALSAGKYSLFTIPNDGGVWTLIFNTEPELWGAFKYNENKDALRIDVMTEEHKELVEKLQFTISEDGKVTMEWAYLSFSFELN
jgi:hypothetical protein